MDFLSIYIEVFGCSLRPAEDLTILCRPVQV